MADESQASEVTNPSEVTTSSDETNNFKVGWNEPADQDPENPMNWSTRRKWSIIGLLSFITFLT